MISSLQRQQRLLLRLSKQRLQSAPAPAPAAAARLPTQTPAQYYSSYSQASRFLGPSLSCSSLAPHTFSNQQENSTGLNYNTNTILLFSTQATASHNGSGSKLLKAQAANRKFSNEKRTSSTATVTASTASSSTHTKEEEDHDEDPQTYRERAAHYREHAQERAAHYKEKAQDGAHSAGAMMKQYGPVFFGTYLTVYGATLGGLYVGVESGLLDPVVLLGYITGNHEESRSSAVVVAELLQHYTLTESWAETVLEKPHLAQLAVAWVATKFTEPLRLAATAAVTPRVARYFNMGPAKSEDEEEEKEKDKTEEPTMNDEKTKEGETKL